MGVYARTVLYCTVQYCTVLYCTLIDFSSTDIWKVMWKSQGPVMIISILNNLFKIQSLLTSLLIYCNLLAGQRSWCQDNFFQNVWKVKVYENLYFFGMNVSGCIPESRQWPLALLGWGAGLWRPRTFMATATRFSYSYIWPKWGLMYI